MDIIKNGGFKISALEVERHLLAHPHITGTLLFPGPRAVPRRDGRCVGAWLERQPWLGGCRREAARGLLPGGSFPAFPLARLGPSKEQAAFKARCYSSPGAEAVKPVAGCQVSSSSHLILEMRL